MGIGYGLAMGLGSGLSGLMRGREDRRRQQVEEEQRAMQLETQRRQQEAFLENIRAQTERAQRMDDFTMAREGYANRVTPEAEATIGAQEQAAASLPGFGAAVGGAAQAAGAIQRRGLSQGGPVKIGPSQREQEQATVFRRQQEAQSAQDQRLSAAQAEMAALVQRAMDGDQEAKATVLSRQPALRTLFEPQAPVMGSPEWQAAQRFQTDEAIRRDRAGVAARGSASGEQAGRPLPMGVVSNIATNRRQLSIIDEAMRELEKNPQAVGPRNRLVPDFVQDNLSGPKWRGGVPARAAIADIGSMEIRDRSGAAVTASEFPRLAPFIPSPNDAPEVVRQKLARMRAVIEEETSLYEEYYGREQGYAPLPGRGGQQLSPDDVQAALRDPEYAEYLRSIGAIP